MKPLTSVQKLQHLQNNIAYFGVKQFCTWTPVATALLTMEKVDAVAGAAMLILFASQKAVDYSSVESLFGYISVKILSAATLSCVTAVAFLALTSAPITGTVVATYASWLSAPTIAELLLELTVVAYYSLPTADERALKKAKSHMSSNPGYAFQILQDAAKRGYPKCMLEFGKCYEKGIGITKNQRLAEIWKGKGLVVDRFYPSQAPGIARNLDRFLTFFPKHYQKVEALEMFKRTPLEEFPSIFSNLISASHGATSSQPIVAYRRLIDDNHVPTPVQAPVVATYGKKAAFNPGNILATETKHTFADLPPGVKGGDLRRLLEQTRKRLNRLSNQAAVQRVIRESFSDIIEDTRGNRIGGSVATLDKLIDNLMNHPMIDSAMNETGYPNQAVPQLKYQLYWIIHHIKGLSNTPAQGEILSPREQALLSFSSSVQKCNRGRKEGISVFYNCLPVESRDSKSASGGQGKTRDYISTLVQDFIDAQFTGETPFMRDITREHHIHELTHRTTFARHLIGRHVGRHVQLEFDIYTGCAGCIPDLSLAYVLKRYYHHVTPELLVDWVTRTINDASKSPHFLREKDYLYQGVMDWCGRGASPWDLECNPDGSVRYTLKETGTLRLLGGLGFLKVTH